MKSIEKLFDIDIDKVYWETDKKIFNLNEDFYYYLVIRNLMTGGYYLFGSYKTRREIEDKKEELFRYYLRKTLHNPEIVINNKNMRKFFQAFICNKEELLNHIKNFREEI